MKTLSAILILCLWLPGIHRAEGNHSGECELAFDTASATDIANNTLKDPNTIIEFQNIRASDHACFKRFTNGHAMGTHTSTHEYLIPDEGIILSTGVPEDVCLNDSDLQSFQWSVGGDADLTSLVADGMTPQTTYDACVIEFDFRCSDGSPRLSVGYIFGSDEYLELGGGDFHDVFALFLNGNNIALLLDGQTTVSISNVNSVTNAEYFVGNNVYAEHPYPINADGFTTKLSAEGALNSPSTEWNTMKLAIADKSDNILDSWLLLETGSFTCAGDETPSNEDANPTPPTEDLSINNSASMPTASKRSPPPELAKDVGFLSPRWYPNIYDPENPFSCVFDSNYSDWMGAQGLDPPYLFESEEDCCGVHYCEESEET